MVWPARYVADPVVLFHLPLLFWLMQQARPTTVLGLGLRSATAYFGLCQAIDALAMPARAWGYGDWSGVPATGPAVPDELRSHNTQFYSEISHLAKVQSLAAALDRFDPGLFDFILVDGTGDLGDVETSANRLIEHASDRGIVLLYGLGRREAHGDPSCALLARLAADHPAIEFEGPAGDGPDNCAVILVGRLPDPNLEQFARAPEASLGELRQALRQLGQDQLDIHRDLNAVAEARQPAAQMPVEAPRPQSGAEPTAATGDDEQLLDATDAALELPATPSGDTSLREELDASCLRLEQLQTMRLRDAHVLTSELEALSEKLSEIRLEAAQAEDKHLQDAALAASATAEAVLLAGLNAQAAATARTEAGAAQAELTDLRIRHFDEVERLTGEVVWLTQDNERLQVLAETAKAETVALHASAAAQMADVEEDYAQRIEILVAAHQTEIARLSSALAASQTKVDALEAAQAATAQALAKASQHQQHLTQQFQSLQQETAKRDSRRLVQLRLRDWQLSWVSSKTRLSKKTGPSGGRLAEERSAIAQHRLFDADWYLSEYPDVKDSKMPAAEHFLQHGLFDGRNPGPDFHTITWFENNLIALSERKNPLLDPELTSNV